MANPPHLFRADWRLDEQVPHIRPWSAGVVAKIGSDPRSSCVEDFSLGILGSRLERFSRQAMALHLHPHRPPAGRTPGTERGRVPPAVPGLFRQGGPVTTPRARPLPRDRGLDGPGGPATPPPEARTVDVLIEAIRRAGARILVGSPKGRATGGIRQVCWDEQLDIRPITADAADEEKTDRPEGRGVRGEGGHQSTREHRHPGPSRHVLACKGTRRDPDSHSSCGPCNGRRTRHDNGRRLGVSLHAQGRISVCWTAGGLPELEELRARPSAHMLGFWGHFSTKSRRVLDHP